MSTIKLEISVDVNNIEIVTDFLAKISVQAKGVKNINVVDAETVSDAPAKTPAKRASRAKTTEPEKIEEPDDEDFELDEPEAEDEPEKITKDDLREVQAKKVELHRETIKAHYKKLGVKGITELADKDIVKTFDFLSKLK